MYVILSKTGHIVSASVPISKEEAQYAKNVCT